MMTLTPHATHETFINMKGIYCLTCKRQVIEDRTLLPTAIKIKKESHHG